MNLDHHFVQVSKLSEDQKRKVFNKTETLFAPNSGEDQKKKEKTSPKMEHVFSPNSSWHLRSYAHQREIKAHFWPKRVGWMLM